ncbi:imelysin family protein [Limibacter armeniacum]|uniref:imelysin family protein n=1 Tax=Limibacter armeniacum TaxID=466084 RepID=UPI002FE68000
MKKVLTLLLAGALFASCDNETEPTTDNSTLEAAVLENYSEIVYATYDDAYLTALALQNQVNLFLNDPSQAALEDAKKAWLAAREPYGQSEAFRFYGGPIDDADGPEGQLNAWPLDEAHIDYVVEGSGTNIINDTETFPEITKEVLLEQNENGSETNVALGYHAIEFLLWGQDLSDGPGGGERPYTDYTTADNANRRATYLKLAIQILVDDLASLRAEWAEGGDYRTTFVAENGSIGYILSGMGKLSKGELAGERIFVAYDEQSKEDEHSCFSDNTHRDIVTNALGIKNVYLGSYTRVDGSKIDGAGIDDLVQAKDETLNTEITSLVNESVETCEAIQSPFDQEILSSNPDGRERVKNAFTILREQGDKIAEAAQVLGYSFDPSDI